MWVDGSGAGSCYPELLILRLTTLTSIHDPMEIASVPAPPATDLTIIINEPYDVVDDDSDDSDASSEVSYGNNLRVRSLLFPPTVFHLQRTELLG